MRAIGAFYGIQKKSFDNLNNYQNTMPVRRKKSAVKRKGKGLFDIIKPMLPYIAPLVVKVIEKKMGVGLKKKKAGKRRKAKGVRAKGVMAR